MQKFFYTMWDSTIFEYINEVEDFLNNNKIINAQIMFDTRFNKYVVFYTKTLDVTIKMR